MTAGSGRLFPLLLGVGLALLASRPLGAAAAPAAVKKIEALNARAISAYETGDSKQAEGLLQEAVVLAKQKGLATHAVVARTYLTLGLILIDGLAEEERGERFFALALRIDPAIKMKATANEAVSAAFARAQVQAAKDREKEAALAREEQGAEATADATASEGADGDSAEDARKLKLMKLAYEKETRDQEAQARAEQKKIRSELEESQDAARKEREAKAKLYTERTLLASEKDGLAAELKGLKADNARLEAERTKLQAERDKLQAEGARLLKEKQELDRQLGEARARDKQQEAELAALKKQREADLGALQKKRENDLVSLQKQQEAERARLAREKSALDRQLADAAAREKAEREAKLKLEEEKKQALARQAEEQQKEKERLERDKQLRARLAEAPDMPSSLPQKVYCVTADAHPRGADVYVHCATQPQVKAEQLTLYYRPSGHASYSSAGMERSRGGWRTAMIPAAVVKGTMLQYYVEAHSGRRVAASNGKPTLPNVTMVNQFPTVASETPGLVPAGGAKARGRSKRARPQ
jgi:hypothetical protein